LIPGVVDVACVGHVLIVPYVGFVLVFTSVINSWSLLRFTNAEEDYLIQIDYEKSCRLTMLFGFMP
jgi:hypothetical protein